MIRILAVNICILLLTLVTAAASGHASLMLLAGGLLMLVTTAAYMKDDADRRSFVLQLGITFLFAVLSEQWYGYLVFALLPGVRTAKKLLLT
ncbi:MAG: hypothetical protein IKH46_15495, partial [Lachnospiraceae bacterium]|nr:hypothetical protein [Lachnospiraceae bacterium]